MLNAIYLFTPKPSRWLLWLHVILFIIACGCVVEVTLPGLVKWGLLVATFVFSGWVIMRDVLCSLPTSLSQLLFTHQEWQLRLRNGDLVCVTVEGSSVVTRYWCLLSFRQVASRRRYRCVLMVDSLPADVFSQLRFLLRCFVSSQG